MATPPVGYFSSGASNDIREPECCGLLLVAGADLLFLLLALIVRLFDRHLVFVHDDDIAAGDGLVTNSPGRLLLVRLILGDEFVMAPFVLVLGAARLEDFVVFHPLLPQVDESLAVALHV